MTSSTEFLAAADEGDLHRAISLLKCGEVVAFPTETVYGLGANGMDAAAVQKIFQAKGRPGDNPLILHVASLEQALPLWQASDSEIRMARQLADAFWPGPLSLVLTANSAVPEAVTAGLGSVAVRVPVNSVSQRLLQGCSFPLAAPSANLSSRPSPTQASHVAATLDGRIAAILDGGETELGIESTVLDIRGAEPRLLRPGTITLSAIESIVGEVSSSDAAIGSAPSPGLRHRHYQPQGISLQLVDTQVLAQAWDESVAIICLENSTANRGVRNAPLLCMPNNASDYGAKLYAVLYELEQSGVTTVLVEKVPDSPQWQAVNDRLRRAAGG